MLVTGHTGFKGAWLALWLEALGAEVVGVALPPESKPNLWSLVEPKRDLIQYLGDIRNPAVLAQGFGERPEVVFHLAAQSLVRRGYREPAETFDVNVGGTARVVEAALGCPSVRALLVVTSDKVYAHGDGRRMFDEAAALGGGDPYSASKACCEMVVSSFRERILAGRPIGIATARSGNVIGGGDWSADRLVPDLVRMLEEGRPLPLRYPNATRPWQHVLDPLRGYLMLAERLVTDPKGTPAAMNFGPPRSGSVPVSQVAEMLSSHWGGPGWKQDVSANPPEDQILELSSDLAARELDWRPTLGLSDALEWTADWYGGHRGGSDASDLTLAQIQRFESLAR